MTITPTTSGTTQGLPGVTPAAATPDALSSLSTDYNSFLTLLTTQLKNQDPSNPTDTSQFTSELAQFAGVEQQISTNTNLTSLIQITQSQQVLQGASLLGHTVDLNGGALPLQASQGQVDFTAPVAETATITVTDANNNVVVQQSQAASAGSNRWDWNGLNTAGVTVPDGAYTVQVTGTGSDGSTAQLAETTRGTVTGIVQSGGTVQLQLGAASLPISSLAKIEG